ncbi:DNA primase [Patescibacteria group bacterium]|nr:DNA primase [Patescibacteria group bacterium]MBU1029051.1 DNA primase [Patescibacteria group bacterium]
MSSDGTIEEIKQRLDIAEVVGDYLQLKKAGTSFKACCPFHQEKTPSFFVNPERQIYHCFGCGEGGDIFEFVQKMEGLEFFDALRLLANKAGVKLESRAGDDQRSEKKRLWEANLLAAKLYHHLLLKDERAATAREYVQRRALKPETVENFLLGYAPDSWEATSKFLSARGFTPEEIFKAGLSIKSERGSGYYDRFRGRLMFPICDVHGQIVGFTARLLPGADGHDPDGPKYVNTPQTLIYDKSRALYGINLAKQDIRRSRVAVVVEGNMDVIASHQAGVKNVVASSGTALTTEQCDILKRFTDRLVLSFDNDEAGESAAKRGIDTATAAGFSLRILRLPEGAGKDPDDCIRQDVKLWQKAIADAAPYMTWFIEQVTNRMDFNDAEAKRRAAEELLAEIVKIPNAVERAHWVSELARLFGTAESLLLERVKELLKQKSKITGGQSAKAAGDQADKLKPTQPIKKDRHVILSEFVLGLAFYWPELAPLVVSALESGELAGDSCLYSLYLEYYNSRREGDDSSSNFRAWLEVRKSNENARLVAILELQAEKEFGELTLEGRKAEVDILIGELKSLHISRQKLELTRDMAAAEKSGDMKKIREIQEKLNEVIG